MDDRLILHCDLNNFFASVETALNPALVGVPLIVAGDPEKRHGVVVAKNEIAKAAGIKTGDTVLEAKRKLPEVVAVPPRHNVYAEYSRKAFGIYTRFTDRVEPFGLDECWLDCTGSENLFGSGKTIADSIREIIRCELELTASVGVSFNKVFAKLGSDYKKPDATTVITRENFRSLIGVLPVADLFMVGRKTAEKLNKLNIFTINDLADSDAQLLKSHFGINGIALIKSARGEDDDEVRQSDKKRKIESVGHGMTATRDIRSYDDAAGLIYYLSDLVARRMRRYNVRGTGVKIDLRTVKLKSFCRQMKVPPTYSGTDIANAAITLLKTHWDLSVPLRTLTVSAINLISVNDPIQTSLFGDERKSERLEKALDTIRQKHGEDKIFRGAVQGQDFIYDRSAPDDEEAIPFKR